MYRVDPSHPGVVEQIKALPVEALLGYAETLGVMELDPWAESPWRGDNPDGNIRTLPFGAAGMVTYLILKRDREVHVLEVQWVG
ncbi:MAG: hypothetical protein ACRDTC_22510 [Pseudonocardiaceae bacterium]